WWANFGSRRSWLPGEYMYTSFVDGFDNFYLLCLGLGFVTSIMFIFLVGVFILGEWFIKRMPFVRHIYNASKQISSAISPVAIIMHPRISEYVFGFITSSLVNYSGEEDLFCVYVPTNHLYLGDIFLVIAKMSSYQIYRTVKELVKIVVSEGMSMPQILLTLETQSIPDRSRPGRN
ncbi:hypothetical protein MKX03_032215, partial [Papaver bracteatum]